MIVKIPLVLTFVIYINDVSSASFSKVFVQRGPDHPIEHVNYGTPLVSYSPQIAQLTAAPVVPYTPNYVPCGTTCVYPSQAPSMAPNSNVVQYQSQSIPVVVAQPRSESSGYEYGYAVYDDQTGDYKMQRELSDGTLVRGGYTFLQPDGFIREVQYVADDLKGFNAVVKNYLPISVESNKHDNTEKSESEPSLETKNDHSETDKTIITEEKHSHEYHNAKPSHENLKAHARKEHHDHNEHFHKHVEGYEYPHAEHHEAVVESFEEIVHPEIQEKRFPEQYEHKSHKKLSYKTEENTAGSTQEELPAGILESFEKPQSSVNEQGVLGFIENVVSVAGHKIENGNVLVPYKSIIRCVQNAINGANEVSTQKPESALTYIILNKPC